MTDSQMAELLYLFHQIEELMVKNDAKKTNADGSLTSFSDKVKSFDNFEKEPADPGDIGYKFYYDAGSYHIKDDYDYGHNIYTELEEYEAYKSYKKRHWEYRNKILGGNYHTLKQIGHERNQLLHIYDYQIKNYSKFVKDCKLMMKYLEKPDKKPFLGYESLHSTKSTSTIVSKRTSYPSKSTGTIGSKRTSYHSKSTKSGDAFSIMFWILGLTSLVGIVKVLVYAYHIEPYFLLGAIGYGVYALFTGNWLPVLAVAVIGWVMIFSDNSSKERHHSNYDEKKTVLSVKYKKENTHTESKNKHRERATQKERVVHNNDSRNHTSTKRTKANKACQYYYIQANKLHIRASASATGRKIGSVNKNTKVCIRKTKNGWSYIDGKGWVSSKFLSMKRVKKKKISKQKQVSKAVWHCKAASQRASGWVEKVGKQNAIRGAIRQCELRRQTNTKCRIVNCYKL